MKRKHFITVIILFIFSLGLFNGISGATDLETQVKAIANKGFAKILAGIKPCYKDFHFVNEKDVDKAYLGNPIAIYNIDPVKYDTNKDIDAQLKEPMAYIFPIMVNKSAVTDMSVTPALHSKHQWAISDWGGHMCKDIQNLEVQCKIKNIKIVWSYQTCFLVGKDTVTNKTKVLVYEYYDYPYSPYKVFSKSEINQIITSDKEKIER